MGACKDKRKPKKRVWLVGAIVILSLLTALLVWGAKVLEGRGVSEPSQSAELDDLGAESQEFEPFALGQGLEVTLMGSYAGIYMEDGSDDVVSNVMMIVLKNSADADLQLARVDLAYADCVAEFEVTNLPVGHSVVLLEKNRRPYPGTDVEKVQVKNVVFFSEPMTLAADRFEIAGDKGIIELTNISGEDIAGEISIFYKNSASDLLYGGITYRARVEGGLSAGETGRIMTGHFDPDSSKIVSIVCSE